MSVYYNEHDPFAAAWLRELMKAGEIPDGIVDERDIQDVAAADVGAFIQCHFFAGIGGWPLALRLADWGNRPVWTGSCPCQPFSGAGKQKGGGDDRHLWPHWARLIRECHPATIVGEQVESAIAHGWLDAVFDDLESEGYACGAVDLPAASVGAPHRRQRIWFVADHDRAGRDWVETPRLHGRRTPTSGREAAEGVADGTLWNDADGCGDIGELGHATDTERGRGISDTEAGTGTDGERRRGSASAGALGLLGDSDHPRSQGRGLLRERAGERAAGATGVADGSRDLGIGRNHSAADELGESASEGLPQRNWERTGAAGQCLPEPERASGAASFWADCTWLPCRDGKWRAVEPGTFPLAHGVSARVGRLRGYGNAITPQVAAEVLKAFLSLEES